jgi:predicted NBD/HSP70 family sugar kinase
LVAELIASELNTILEDRGPATPTGRIVRALSERGSLSAVQISRITGLAKSTVSATLAELRKSGMVIEADASLAGKSVGRPATVLTLNPDAGTCIGVQLGLGKVQVVVADVSHAIINEALIDMEQDYSPADAVEAVRRAAGRIYAANKLPKSGLLGIGLAFSGPVNPATGKVMRASILPAWEGVSLGDLFGPVFERPVFADNESNCAALAEMMWGAAQGAEDFLLFKIDLGVGGAIVNRGRVMTGIAGGAGEFGHMTIDPAGPLCRCGNRGCLELTASFVEPLRHASKRFGRAMTMDDVIALARDGDAGCRRLIENTAEIAGRGLAMIGTIINPGLIVIGGRMALAGDMLLDPLRAAFEKHTLIKSGDVAAGMGTRMVAGRFTENDGCLGAVGLVLRHHGRL